MQSKVMFSIRYLKQEDYNLLCDWWKEWNWDIPPRDFLPENGTGGFMVEKDGNPVIAGFIYFTNSAVAWSEFIISDKNYGILRIFQHQFIVFFNRIFFTGLVFLLKQ